MSGGSMDYLYSKLEYATFQTDTPLRRAFRKHLDKVAKALHDIEWVDSADYGPGDEEEAIRACLDSADIVNSAIEEVHAAINAFKIELEKHRISKGGK